MHCENKKYLQIVLNNFTSDNRILKQCKSLCETGEWAPIVYSMHDKGQQLTEEKDFVSIRRFPLITRPLPKWLPIQLIKYLECWIRMFFAARVLKPDFIQANDLNALPIGLSIAKFAKCPLLYDAHELETERQGTKKGSIKQKLMVWLERKLIRASSSMLTVSNGIAEWYAKNYNISKPMIVRNIPYQSKIMAFPPVDLKKVFGISADSFLFIYIGGLAPGRGIPEMLEFFSKVNEDRHLIFLGDGVFRKKILDFSSLYKNIHLHPPVSPEEVINFAAGADVGISFIECVSLSYYYSLPNKFFEYLFSGIPVIIKPLPDQKELVELYNCGWVLDGSNKEIVSFIDDITEEMIMEKKLGVKKALEELSWGNEATVYINAVNSALAKNH